MFQGGPAEGGPGWSPDCIVTWWPAMGGRCSERGCTSAPSPSLHWQGAVSLNPTRPGRRQGHTSADDERLREELVHCHNEVGMSCPSWQWNRTGSCWSPVRTRPVAPLWCDLGFFPTSRGNKGRANLRPSEKARTTITTAEMRPRITVRASGTLTAGLRVPPLTCYRAARPGRPPLPRLHHPARRSGILKNDTLGKSG